MGNNPSKSGSGGGSSSSPVTNHSSNLLHSRKESKASTHAPKIFPSNPPTTPQPSPHQLHTASANSSPTSKQYPAEKMGNDHSRQRAKEAESRRKDHSAPVKVPRGTDLRRQRGPDSQFEPSGSSRDPDYVPHSNLNFPPRLPLPIEEEVHAPGSPIITPADVPLDLNENDVEGALPRQSSAFSSTTADEDDIAGGELQSYPMDGTKRTVPTLVQWKQGGERIYVTGTFASWSRKFRMHREMKRKRADSQMFISAATNIPSAILQLPPGTHHVKFIVDGEMQLSNELPTAVDYTNILVNYIEVSADDLPKEPKKETNAPEGIYPPQSLPSGTEVKDHAPDSVGKPQAAETEQASKPVFWGDEIPLYLQDLELSEESKRYQRASRGATDFAVPPSIPVFLQKLILNQTTPMKDDNSVLNMPNHTMLNHLATSSIKNQVLATSVTTRYKRKYVTTMMYKPTVDDSS
ncbi:MAG: hypothetical protein LQ351_002339 [Letrouitia transgressa]|nr:MAG: hypothetical protein LQ351_002339 [Letrouitia transgressa]